MAPRDIAISEGEGLAPKADAGGRPHKPAFDPLALEPRRFSGLIAEFVQRYPQLAWGPLRWAFRVVHFPFTQWYFVLRQDDVREVLAHDKVFPVRWDGRMKENTDGLNFVLGMPRDETYRRRYTELAKAFPLADVGRHVAHAAAIEAREIVDKAAARDAPTLDGVEQLVTEVPARLCKSYYGIDVQNPTLFAKWTLAISAYTFGPTSTQAATDLARAAAAELSGAIRRSITAARALGAQNPAVAPVMQRLIAAFEEDNPIHAHLFGMVLGFIPTDVLAGGNMLEVLLRRPDFLEQARAAALADDDELLWKCLREALRFRHINLGAWRGCAQDYKLSGARFGGRIPAGPKVKMLAVVPSAMFDARRVEHPNVFDPHRPEEDYLTFGVGQHWCLGAYIAKVQITQTFKPLLKRTGLRAVKHPVFTTRFDGLFPLHLQIAFDR